MNRRSRHLLALLAVLPLCAGCYNMLHPLPEGISYAGAPRATDDVRFLRDLTWVDREEERFVEQQIFDEILSMIAGAERLPNRPVAADLHEGDVAVRWCDTYGEQCHAKLIALDRRDGTSFALLGSANFTRRNLQDFNLETSVALRGPSEARPFADIRAYFDLVWGNEEERRFSVAYEVYADEALRKKFLYRVEETTGLSTF